MLVHSLLERSAKRNGDAIAVQTEAGALTYSALDEAANALAHGLIRAGVNRGDRVAILLDNRLETVVSIFGALKAGAAFMMVHPATKADKLDFLLRHSEAGAIVLPAARCEAEQGLLSPIATLRCIVTADRTAHRLAEKTQLALPDLRETMPRHAPVTAAIDQDLAGLLYTSGSTGEPKGVMLTHRNIRSAISSISAYLRLSDRDVLMDVLPLSFSYGLTQLFSAISVGASFVLEKSLAFPHVTLTRIAQYGVTGLAVVPSAAAVLLGLDLAKYDLGSLRYVTNAGAGMPVAHVRRFRQKLPHVDLFLMYGQTECMRISYLDPSEVDRRPDSVGRGMPNQELHIVGDDGQVLGPGEVGELVVRGSHVMAGYWRRPDITNEALHPGPIPGERVLHTRDLFRRDADGYYYFVARRDDIFKTRGMKVSGREVENALYRLEHVVEAAVVGADGGVQGQVVKAVVVVRPGVQLSANDVKRHCARHLEDYMVPAIVEFRESLPKTASGKILTTAL